MSIEFIENINQIDFIDISERKDKNIISVHDLVRSPLRRRLSLENKDTPHVKYLFKSILKSLIPSRVYSVFYDDMNIIFSVDIFDKDKFFNIEFISEEAFINQRYNFYERESQIIKYFLETQVYNKKFFSFGNIFFIINFRLSSSNLPSPIVKITYNDDPNIENYIRERIKLHKEGSFCSDEDMMIRKRKDGKFIPYGCLFYCSQKNICEQGKIFVLYLDK